MQPRSCCPAPHPVPTVCAGDDRAAREIPPGADGGQGQRAARADAAFHAALPGRAAAHHAGRCVSAAFILCNEARSVARKQVAWQESTWSQESRQMGRKAGSWRSASRDATWRSSPPPPRWPEKISTMNQCCAAMPPTNAFHRQTRDLRRSDCTAQMVQALRISGALVSSPALPFSCPARRPHFGELIYGPHEMSTMNQPSDPTFFPALPAGRAAEELVYGPHEWAP
jgi:hypothetical protein